jgi:hypothetical protein
MRWRFAGFEGAQLELCRDTSNDVPALAAEGRFPALSANALQPLELGEFLHQLLHSES